LQKLSSKLRCTLENFLLFPFASCLLPLKRMTATQNIKYNYQFKGAIDFRNPTYLHREADRELLAALKAGNFCYVSGGLHSGKTSLMLKTIKLLKAENYICVALDFNEIKNNLLSVEEWYEGAILELETVGNLSQQSIDLWWSQKEEISAIERLIVFIEEVFLPNVTQKIVIFIDGIKSDVASATLRDRNLNNPLEDLWALIEYCHLEKGKNKKLERLQFALFGESIPQDIQQLGKAFKLENFEWKQVKPLIQGFQGKVKNPEAVMGEILYWTEGQPFLTQKVCKLVENYLKDSYLGNKDDSESDDAGLVEDLVKICIIENWESQDEPPHSIGIRDRLLKNNPNPENLLKLYQKILNPPLEFKLQHSDSNKVGIIADNSAEQQELIAVGLVSNKEEILKVNNPIYAAVFNEDWVKEELEKIAVKKEETSRIENHERGREKPPEKKSEKNSAAETAKLEKTKEKIKIAVAGLVVLSLAAAGGVVWAIEVFRNTQKQLQTTETQLYQAQKELQEAQEGTKLEQQGVSALRQFEFAEIEALLSAIQAGKELKEIVESDDRPLPQYPAISPIFALQQILQNIHERNQIKNIKYTSFSPTSEILAAIATDGTARLLKPSGQTIAEFKGHEGPVSDITFSTDGKLVATAGEDGTARVWDLFGKEIVKLEGHEGNLWDVTFSPDGQRLATAGEDGTARLWDISGKQIAQLKGHEGRVLDVAFSPDGERLATASWDETARLWSTRSGKQLARLRGHEGSVETVTFSPDSQKLATAGWDGSVRIWSRATGKLLAKLQGHEGGVWNVSFSPDGQRLATGGEDGTAYIWDASGEQIAKLQGHKGIVSSISFSRDGKLLATAGSDGTVRLWELDGNLLAELKGHRGRVWEVNFSVGELLATTGEDGIARIWQLSKEPLTEVEGSSSIFANVSFSPNGNYMATAALDGTARIWDLSGKPLSRFQGYLGLFGDMTFSPDGQRIATAGDDSPPRLWKISGEELVSFQGHDGRVRRVSLSPDGQRVATAGTDGTARIWELSGQELAVLQGHQGPVWDVTFSPDGQRVATAGEDGTARIWNSSGQQLMELEGRSGRIESVSFSPDGLILAAGGSDGIVRFWDTRGAIAQSIRELSAHRGSVEKVAFSSDGQRLATRAADGTIRIWDLAGRPMAEFKHGKSVSPDGELVATGENGALQLWEVKQLDELLTAGCSWLEDYFVTHPHKLQELKVCQNQK